MNLQQLISGLAVLGSGIGLLIHGDTAVGTALTIAGGAELGAHIVLPGAP